MRTKPRSIAFRVTEEQHKMINEKAKNSNLSKTDFIVKCCFDKEIIIVNDVRELMKELLSVGNNLTQLTTRAKLMNLEVVDLKPTYMKFSKIPVPNGAENRSGHGTESCVRTRYAVRSISCRKWVLAATSCTPAQV